MAIYTNKTVSLRREQFLSSWLEFAPDVTFAGLTLAQFEDKSKTPLNARKSIREVQTKLRGLLLDRDKADELLNQDLILIAHAIRGNELFGEDCAFYRSLGFIPKSERRTGTGARKKAELTAPAAPPPNTDVA
jgi:hypothetical protein